MSKVVQITAALSERGGGWLVALREDGTLWEWGAGRHSWKKLPDVPQTETGSANDQKKNISELAKLADYLVPQSSRYNISANPPYYQQTHPIGQQPEGSVMIPGSERSSDERD